MATSIVASIEAVKSQVSIGVLAAADDALRMSLLGQLYVADWKYLLAAAGRLWRLSIGTIAADANITLITGGGAGTIVDLEQPEGLIGVGTGYVLIPVECHVACQVDLDADGEEGNIILIADRTQAPPTSVTGTIETPDNQLDGGADFPGDAYSAITTDLLDPVVSEILDFETIQASDFISASGAATGSTVAVASLKMKYEPLLPDLLRGPCQVALYWGGTAAVPGIGSLLVGAVPSAWFPVE